MNRGQRVRKQEIEDTLTQLQKEQFDAGMSMIAFNPYQEFWSKTRMYSFWTKNVKGRTTFFILPRDEGWRYFFHNDGTNTWGELCETPEDAAEMLLEKTQWINKHKS